ncbi:MAG: hypothetical protein CBB97_07195 [Candidatus Endolissoclinum sp. TMED37]|nr:MAG: hypothetical protein CBB97_07195 [Candidatus Endolissoclinum sp. TMED37]
MPKQIRNFQELEINGRILNSKEIRLLRKFAGVAGRRLIDEVAANKNHKHRDFVLEIWNEYFQKSLRRKQVFVELLCDVKPGTFEGWWVEQGLQQKKTFRLNKCDENMSHARYTMARGRWAGLKTVYKVNTHLSSNGRSISYRLETMESYVVANNREEANSVWSTMVLAPLGLIEIEKNGYGKACDAVFYAPARFCNLAQLNSNGRHEIIASIEKEKERIKKRQTEIDVLARQTELAFALATSTLLATNG